MEKLLKTSFSQTLAKILVFLMVMHPWSLRELSQSYKSDQEPSKSQSRVLGYLDFKDAHAGELTVFGPKKYIRTTGKPNVYTDSFSSTAKTATLVVLNGEANGRNRLSSAIILVNGVEVLGPSDFNQKVYRLEKTIDLVPTNALTVELRSVPQGFC